MATAAYWTWVNNGRPWSLAQPIRDLQQWAIRNGVKIIGTIGNEEHLTSDFPQDHTPFSFTEWPVPIGEYIVCAIDLVDGPWSDVLLRDCRSGKADFIKYLNFRNVHYSIRDGWTGTPSSDKHLHISIRSDYVARSVTPYMEAMMGTTLDTLRPAHDGTDRSVAHKIDDLHNHIFWSDWDDSEGFGDSVGAKLNRILARPLLSDEQVNVVAAKVAEQIQTQLVTLILDALMERLKS